MAHVSMLGPDCHQAVAVIGLACRFPADAVNPEEFWDFLCNARSAYSDLPKDRFNIEAFHSDDRSKVNSIRASGGHFLREDVAAFDANFFSINQVEAMSMDPNQRIMLEIVYEALESAGLSLKSVAGTNTGCYVGNFNTDYREMVFGDRDAIPKYSMSGLGHELISNRVSWFYDLKGPCFTLGTACSSSLVALHQACQSISTGETSTAIVGGSNLLLNPDMFLALSNQNFLSPAGRCCSFDAVGNGYGRGDGFAAVILKNVDEAIRDGDAIRAVIRGTGVNQNGRTTSITRPSAEAQADLIRSTYRLAGLDFGETNYFEAHGTGTKAGDPLELEGITSTICSARREGNKLLVGSVKSNIGHTEATAGLAGLIKGIKMLESGMIPPNVNLNKLNPRIPFDEWRIAIPRKLQPWPTSGLRRMSVQSFGYGGTNAHAILDDAFHYLRERNRKGLHFTKNLDRSLVVGQNKATTSNPGELRLFAFSAQDKDGLQRQRQNYVKYLSGKGKESAESEETFLRDLAFTLSTKRSRLSWKQCIIAPSLRDLRAKLASPDVEEVVSQSSRKPRIAFIFTGQGAQWPRMGQDLLQYRVFEDSVRSASDFLCNTLQCPWSVLAELSRKDSFSNISIPSYSQPLCTILQVALVDLLVSWNITPSAIVGHSSGEIAGAYCLGALSREDAWKAAYYRGLSSSQIKLHKPPIRGAMLALGASEEDAEDIIAQNEIDDVVVACINSPSSVTLSGNESGIDQVERLLKDSGVFARKLNVDTAYHSRHMETVSLMYLEYLRDMHPKRGHPDRKMYSTATGYQADPEELEATHWVRNMVSPVLFYDAMRELLQPVDEDDRIDILLEVGPHPALRASIEQTLKKLDVKDVSYYSVLSRGKNSIGTALATAGDLFTQGVAVDIPAANNDSDDPYHPAGQLLVDLPPYSWNHSRRYWAESRVSRQNRLRGQPRKSLIGAPVAAYGEKEQLWRGFLRTSELPWIRDHKIQSSVLYPAAGYIAMAVEGAAELSDPDRTVRTFNFRDVQIVAPAVMSADVETEFILQLRPHHDSTKDNAYTWQEFTVSSCNDGQYLQQNCYGLLQVEYEKASERNSSDEKTWEDANMRNTFALTKERCKADRDPKAFYHLLDSLGLNYGPSFQNISQLRTTHGWSCCEVTISKAGLSETSRPSERPHIIHPSTLDAMLHAIFAAFTHTEGQMREAMVPQAIDEIAISAQIPYEADSKFKGYGTAAKYGFREMTGDLVMLDSQSDRPCVSLKQMRCIAVAGTGEKQASKLDSIPGTLYSKESWEPVEDLCFHHDADGVKALHHPPSDCRNGTLELSEPTTNGYSSHDEILILQHQNCSERVQDFACCLRKSLQDQRVNVKSVMWGQIGTSEFTSGNYISLLELDSSILSELSSEEFAQLRRMLLECSNLLWVTAMDVPARALAPGLLRSVRNEVPGTRYRTISLQPSALEAPEKHAARLGALATTSTTDDEFREEEGVIKVCRFEEDVSMQEKMSALVNGGKDIVGLANPRKLEGQHKLAVGTQGMLDTLYLEPDEDISSDLGDDEVEMNVKATGLNFRDVMVVMGQIPDNLLGFEASGVVVGCGRNVSTLKIGDKICTLGHGTHRTVFKTKAGFCQKMPEELSFEEAATIPLVHCTAHHALINVARARPGQTILIHAAAGGVGQAAIQLSQHLGLEIFATVGSAEKRELIESVYGIEPDHIFSSRDPSFAKGVLRMTKQKGVRIVLNSLSGEMLRQSWRCIADFGSFVEIGMRDILRNAQLDMAPFQRDVSFTSLNLKHVMVDDPALMQEILHCTFENVRKGFIKPVSPVKVYPLSDMENAFRLLQTGRHRGKIALNWDSAGEVRVIRRPRPLRLEANATYLLVGGFGGLGRSLANLLADAGATSICFISRSGPQSDAAQKLISDLETRHVRVTVYTCDVSDRDQLASLLREARGLPPIKGAFQCAMVLQDSLFEKMSHDQWTRSIRPKVQGSWNLHSLLPDDLDFFIMLSSFAALFGNRSQSNYAAGGAYQDALAQYRRTLGRKAVSVDLGVMRDIGVIAEKGSTDYLKEWELPFGMREKEFQALMTGVVTGEVAGDPSTSQIIHGLLNRQLVQTAGVRTPFYFSDPRFSRLIGSGTEDPAAAATVAEAASLRDRLAQAKSPSEAGKLIHDALVARVAKLFQVDESEIDDSKPLHRYGVDSLVGVEIANWVFQETKVKVSMFDILASISIAEFAKRLAEKRG